MSTVKEVFLKKGKDECITFYKNHFKSDLLYVSNSYKSTLETYSKDFKNSNELMKLIPNSLLENQRIAIAEYEEQVNCFINKLEKIPKNKFLSNIIWCIIFSAIAVFSKNIIFWIILSISILFMINKMQKIYGNRYFDEIEKCYTEIEHKYYNNISKVSNQIHNAIVDLWVNLKKGNN